MVSNVQYDYTPKKLGADVEEKYMILKRKQKKNENRPEEIKQRK
jgi:hypothetical protein